MAEKFADADAGSRPQPPPLAIDLNVEIKTEKDAMGSVADKIAKNIAAQGRSKVIDLTAWREGREIAREAGLDDDRLRRPPPAVRDLPPW